MNPRERLLIAAVGVILLLFMGKAARSAYVAKLADLDNQIRKLEKDRRSLQLDKEEIRFGLQTWGTASAQTLSMDPNLAKSFLRQELFELTDKVGMPDATVGLQEVKAFGKKNGLQVLNCQVRGEGKAEDITRFLFELSEQPYLARCRHLRLFQPTRVGLPKKGPAPVVLNATLAMTADLDTLILPPLKLETGQLVTFDTAQLDPQKRKPVQRTRLASRDEYKDIVERKLFQPYVPPAPEKVADPTPANNATDLLHTGLALNWKTAERAQKYIVYFGEQAPGQPQPETTATTLRPPQVNPGKRYYWRVDSKGEGGTTAGEVWTFMTKAPLEQPRPVVGPTTPTGPPPPPPCQPTDGQLVLGRILCSPLVQQIVLEDPKRKDAPDVRKEIGDQVYCGTLILIHPTGAVSERDGQRRFHPLNEPLQACKPLTEQDFPLVYSEVVKLEQLAAGISNWPG